MGLINYMNRLVYNKYVTSCIHWLFIICGGSFFFNYLLPTNPTSKNPIILFLYGGKPIHSYNWNIRFRIHMCYAYGGMHITFALIYLYTNAFFSFTNILTNLYPIIVQFVIFYRCKRILYIRKT